MLKNPFLAFQFISSSFQLRLCFSPCCCSVKYSGRNVKFPHLKVMYHILQLAMRHGNIPGSTCFEEQTKESCKHHSVWSWQMLWRPAHFHGNYVVAISLFFLSGPERFLNHFSIFHEAVCESHTCKMKELANAASL